MAEQHFTEYGICPILINSPLKSAYCIGPDCAWFDKHHKNCNIAHLENIADLIYGNRRESEVT